MPIRPFFDRANELAALDRALLDRRIGKMALLYGRRRIGKTYLLQHFVSERADRPAPRHVYCLADRSTAAAQRLAVAKQMFGIPPRRRRPSAAARSRR